MDKNTQWADWQEFVVKPSNWEFYFIFVLLLYKSDKWGDRHRKAIFAGLCAHTNVQTLPWTCFFSESATHKAQG